MCSPRNTTPSLLLLLLPEPLFLHRVKKGIVFARAVQPAQRCLEDQRLVIMLFCDSLKLCWLNNTTVS